MGCSINNVSDENFPPSFSAIFKINEIEHDMTSGGYNWERKKGFNTEVVTTDAASPNLIAYLWDANDRLDE